ncbi:STAS domain-containing protein [Streptomyces sp. NPDC045470]|uniref:STAS domain-containing protein n=1 Tax=Streptomyces sp. NPDC045470 TaxID=3155469 RepID=UPI0033D4B855
MTAPENEVHIIDKNTFKVTHTQHGPHTVVGLQGDFDVYSAPALREVLWPLAANARGNLIVVVDSQRRAMEFFDSTCLGVLIGALRKFQASGHGIHVVDAPDGMLRKIFRIAGLSRVMPVHEHLNEAIAAAPHHGQAD